MPLALPASAATSAAADSPLAALADSLLALAASAAADSPLAASEAVSSVRASSSVASCSNVTVSPTLTPSFAADSAWNAISPGFAGSTPSRTMGTSSCSPKDWTFTV